ncbi:hypothetical protein FOXG_18197 [Fusarium oxysporum f. sp. lycopersici 4287]|uniref:Uncharacterized protein n=2 Tax=Fusarium oxysporum TaxID=5507 RepID=A0A0J9UFE1_FUSO4|nr:hypothetical protein FOXG_18197 [Fusarium oxysporum f. sp. lycopersici 4287]EXK42206.1 hypothetical protein FOMG_05251 [Fusarium oxysporum f. sp. melonis 26406]KNA96810.1 hypothetical protein FOXG_18197 [Fusarium oxysporum f. sp. lycopersici 4287]
MSVESQDFLAYSTNPLWESSEHPKFLASFPSLLPTNSEANTLPGNLVTREFFSTPTRAGVGHGGEH